MSNRTQWYIVVAQIMLRNQETVQYAQDDIKTETRPGVRTHQFTFLFEVDEYSDSDYINKLLELHLKNRFRTSPPLEDGKSSRLEIKSIELTKASYVFHVVT